MNKEREIINVMKAIDYLKLGAESIIMKEHSEALQYGADILEDYLKYLRRYVSDEIDKDTLC